MAADKGASISCRDGFYLTSLSTGTVIDTYKSYLLFTDTAITTNDNFVGSQCVGRIPYLYIIYIHSLLLTMQDLCVLQPRCDGG